jgi:hypothetical protein
MVECPCNHEALSSNPNTAKKETAKMSNGSGLDKRAITEFCSWLKKYPTRIKGIYCVVTILSAL